MSTSTIFDEIQQLERLSKANKNSIQMSKGPIKGYKKKAMAIAQRFKSLN